MKKIYCIVGNFNSTIILYKLFYGIYFLLLGCQLFAQDSIVVKGTFVGNTKYAKVLMKRFAVGNFPVGGVMIKEDKFSLALPATIESGVYRFVYAVGEGEEYVDIIINGTEKIIDFSKKANDNRALPIFKSSEENQKWYAYIANTSAQVFRIDLLNQFINAYPNSQSNIAQAAKTEWAQEKELYWQNFETFKKEMSGTWAYEMVVNRPYYFSNPKDDPRIQDYMKREHFWDGFNANNPKLINTPLYTEHILNYLRYWMNLNMNFSAEEKIEGFKRSVDRIIRQFSGNDQTLEFAFKYLTLGFKEIGEEEVLQYLDENYKDLASRCFDDFEKSEFDKRMSGYAAMKVGNIAPDFHLAITAGKTEAGSLYKIKAENTLVVFWSSACPHCLDEMPLLNEWAATQKRLQVVAVSIDTNQAAHAATISKFGNMLHTCDLKGWDSEVATKYFIVATPTFILLDKDKKILKKCSSFEHLKN